VGIASVAGLLVADRIAAVCIALTATILVCEFGRLDMGVRSACASVLIVSIGSDALLARSIERATAVSIGCGLALLLQLATQPVIGWFLEETGRDTGRPDEA
jgi:hypothetical protein